jgi:hypothetical protein
MVNGGWYANYGSSFLGSRLWVMSLGSKVHAIIAEGLKDAYKSIKAARFWTQCV